MRPTEHPLTAFGQRLEEWALSEQERDPLRRKVTQTDMAKLFGVSTSAVSNWKLGHDVPSMNNLATIAERTGIPFAELAALVQEHVSYRRNAKRPPRGPREDD